MNSPNKEVFANNLAYYMNKKGVDRNTLCSDLGLKYTTVRDWLKGITYPRIGKIELLANYFGVQKSDLIENKETLSGSNASRIIKDINDNLVKLEKPRQEKVLNFTQEQLAEQKQEGDIPKVISIHTEIQEPDIEYKVYEKLSAGDGYEYLEDRNYDVVYFNKDIPHDFASWVYGDSMEPDYPSGSVALIKDTGWDYDGAVYAVDWDGQSYIKKVYKEKDGLRLVSLNDKYDDKFAKWEEEPRIIGKVVGDFMPMEK
ncbi:MULTISPECIES: S24 family peptidase [Streptococcus]|jgi:phage repressor protein C with HTH and peptisase S24 domain|uniref:Phage transcriptional repressor n=2 Tax=root TaxID=1 RepID=W1TSP5_STRAP|nr:MULTISPECIES: S24 family peptidase [Streptococcus]ETI84521.1 MAG: Phage transcriptional repressor [Streptococcus anginosus DORA_7]QBX31734.1 pleiotropic regulator of exopolysaccharide synthesis, competence and biofilm formation [Streptococcus phage Javan68]KAA9305162.1 helix-turn-helix transcriptional regulator [Streptococcus anginosus]KAA9320481.1 helix-turn-helix transcriptional regulator [Streptococcus anginosus]MCW1000220.1 helix-turn-helix domain-containing protein [Streptococcus angin